MRTRKTFRPLSFLLIAIFTVPTSYGQQAQPPAPRIVDLKATDGVPLKASYFAAGKPGRGILLLHQCNKQRKVWDGLATKLAAAGMNVLTLDFRGFGESSGVAAYKLPPEENVKMLAETWPADVDIAYQFLKTQPGVSSDLVGAAGASCGVHQAVMFAQRHPEVKSLVLLSETTSSVGRQFIRHAPQLPMLMAAADDDIGEVEVMQWLADISSNPSTRLIRYSIGGHGVDMFIAHSDLPDTIVTWFSTTLKPSATSATPRTAKTQTKQSIFLDLIDEPGGIRKAAQMYAEEHKRNPNSPLVFESLLNRLGYEHLTTGDPQGAVQIFQLNVTAFPNSPNVYDSLSDAYVATGQKDLARQNAKKALELLASDTTDPPDRLKGIKDSAEQKLKQLGDATP